MSSASKFWTRNYLDALEWARFRRNVVITTGVGWVAYSLGSAYFLDKRFDLEYCTEDFKRRVLRMGQKWRQPPPGVEKELSEGEIAKLEHKAEGDRRNNRVYKGSNAFDAIRGRAYVPDTVDTKLLDSFQRPELTVSTALYLESQNSPCSVWDELAPTLSVGDIVMLRGTGSMSWKIANLTYPWTGFDPWALKYTHAGVIVDVDRSKSPPDVWMLEVIDNRDSTLVGQDGTTRTNCAMVSNAKDRIFSIRPEEDVAGIKFQKSMLGKFLYTFFLDAPTEEYNLWRRRCYSRACCRRLEGFEFTPEKLEAVKKFVDKTVGRPMDSSPLVSLAQVSPSLYQRDDPRKITCTEMIVDFYKEVGAVVNEYDSESQKLIYREYEDFNHLVRKSLTYIPYHFTPKGQRSWEINWLRRFTHLGPEEKIFMNW